MQFDGLTFEAPTDRAAASWQWQICGTQEPRNRTPVCWGSEWELWLTFLFSSALLMGAQDPLFTSHLFICVDLNEAKLRAEGLNVSQRRAPVNGYLLHKSRRMKEPVGEERVRAPFLSPSRPQTLLVPPPRVLTIPAFTQTSSAQMASSRVCYHTADWV